MFWLAMIVFAAVLLFSGLAIYRSQRRRQDAPQPFMARPAFFLTAGGIIPLGILVFLVVASVRTSRALHIPMSGTASEELLTIDVIGRQWWWEVRYPEQGILTANEIHIPAGEEVLFRVTSDDVIHSFWVPELHGKIDMMEGRVHSIRLEASQPGIYLGICAEFCGIQHTFMEFLVIAHDQESFANWILARQQVATPSTDALEQRGQAVYFATGCEHCHTIQGITRPESAIGVVGPDLTHLASRTTLAAGRLENTPQNLAAWLLDPHEIKPGVHMPATPLAADDMEALVAFLMKLE
jgi:cytochrome c oxidase subunit 2